MCIRPNCEQNDLDGKIKARIALREALIIDQLSVSLLLSFLFGAIPCGVQGRDLRLLRWKHVLDLVSYFTSLTGSF